MIDTKVWRNSAYEIIETPLYGCAMHRRVRQAFGMYGQCFEGTWGYASRGVSGSSTGQCLLSKLQEPGSKLYLPLPVGLPPSGDVVTGHVPLNVHVVRCQWQRYQAGPDRLTLCLS